MILNICTVYVYNDESELYTIQSVFSGEEYTDKTYVNVLPWQTAAEASTLN